MVLAWPRTGRLNSGIKTAQNITGTHLLNSIDINDIGVCTEPKGYYKTTPTPVKCVHPAAAWQKIQKYSPP